jgi:hypothetical protein
LRADPTASQREACERRLEREAFERRLEREAFERRLEREACKLRLEREAFKRRPCAMRSPDREMRLMKWAEEPGRRSYRMA